MSSPFQEMHITGKHRRPRPKSRFVMRPLKWAARVVHYQRNDIPLSTDLVTKVLIADYRFAFKRRWNSVNIWEGGPGEGKSEGGIRYDRFWCFLTGGELKITYDIDEIPELADGDALHIDEWLIAEGAGKIQAINRVKNLFNTIRAKMIVISISTTKAPELPFATFIATTLAQNFDSRENLFEIRVPLPRVGLVWIGNARIPLHKDEVKRQEYEAKTYARKTGVVNDKGRKTIAPKLDYAEAAQIVRAWLLEQGYAAKTKGEALTAVRAVAKIHNWDINYDSAPDVANLVMMQQGAQENAREYTGQVAALRKATYDQLQEYGFSLDVIKMFREYVESGDSQARIAKRFKITQQSLSNRIRPISEKALGYAFEDVWASKMKREGHRIRQGGKTTPQPDLLILGDGDEIQEVHSVKCYLDEKQVTTINADKIAKSELELWRAGKPLKVVYFDIATEELFIIPYAGQDRISLRKSAVTE